MGTRMGFRRNSFAETVSLSTGTFTAQSVHSVSQAVIRASEFIIDTPDELCFTLLEYLFYTQCIRNQHSQFFLLQVL